MASATDVQIKQKFEANQQGFQLLGKTRQELAASVPVNPAAATVENDPAVVAIKEALDQLNAIKLEKEAVMSEGVAMHDNLNPVDRLMSVHTK